MSTIHETSEGEKRRLINSLQHHSSGYAFKRSFYHGKIKHHWDNQELIFQVSSRPSLLLFQWDWEAFALVWPVAGQFPCRGAFSAKRISPKSPAEVLNTVSFASLRETRKRGLVTGQPRTRSYGHPPRLWGNGIVWFEATGRRSNLASLSTYEDYMSVRFHAITFHDSILPRIDFSTKPRPLELIFEIRGCPPHPRIVVACVAQNQISASLSMA